MSDSAPTAYDTVLYPSAIYPQTHPDRLATQARLFGMDTAPVEGSRVLELGCGDGSNLIAMAYELPSSEFVGLDLAALPIRNGNEVIQKLGLRNVRLHRCDIAEARLDERFDYIIAHGLYSWVPETVRDRILERCHRWLNEQGIAYVSYNAYPGNHLRDMARGMMRFHAAHFSDPRQQIRQARGLLKFLAEAKPEGDVYGQLLRRELERTLKYSDAGFFHDDLSSTNRPAYFHEFVAHAARHGLQYLAEADFWEMQEDGLPEQALAVLNELGADDVITREQYVDFLKGRAFRQTLLCRREVALDRQPGAARAFACYVASTAKPAAASCDVRSEAMEDFAGPNRAVIATSRPTVKAALVRLGKTWPASIHFSDLLDSSLGEVFGESPRDPEVVEAERQALGQFLIRAYALDFVELHVHQPGFVTLVSEQPTASALARLQAQTDSVVATLRHAGLKLEGSLGRNLIQLLDGSRDRKALIEDLVELVRTGKAKLDHDGRSITDAEEAGRIIGAELEQNLESLARSALLVG